MAGILTAAELLSLRAAATVSLPDVCTVRRLTATPDGRGGSAKSWADLGEYPCRLTSKNRSEQTAEGRWVAVTGWQQLLPYGATVGPKDRVDVAGVEYEVLPTIAPTSEAIFCELNVVRTA